MEIFISYAREDSYQAKSIFNYLNSIEELSPWLDQEKLQAGEDWEQNVYAAIERSNLFILILSRNSVNKDGFIQEEIKAAFKRIESLSPTKRFIIPIRIDDSVPSDKLNKFHFIDLFSDWEQGLQKLRAAVTSELTNSLEDAFRNVDIYMPSAQHIQWINDTEDFLQDFSATTVIRFMDEKYKRLKDELFAVELMIDISRKHHKDSLASYILRIHEIGRMSINYPSELAQAYGIFLQKVKLLPGNIRTILLRDAYEAYLEYGRSIGNTFTSCILLLEISKHYIAQSTGRYHSDWLITTEALKTLCKYDLLFLEMVIYYVRRSGMYEILCDIIPILHRYFPKLKYIPSPIMNCEDYLNIRKFVFSSQEEVNSFNHTNIIISQLLRIGEYLSYHQDINIRHYGSILSKIALEELFKEKPVIANLIDSLNTKDRQDFIEKLERYDEIGLIIYSGNDAFQATQLLNDMMISLSYYNRIENAVRLDLISIDSDVFQHKIEIGVRIVK